MSIQERRYNAKLLLFGEYSILHGSKAFSFPIEKFQAFWAKKELPEKSNEAFLRYATEKLASELDIHRMMAEYQDGFFLESNIPYGYGLGSSGSLVAAYLDRYSISKANSLEELKEQMMLLESYFHGKSSGTDPLVSYLNYPLVFHDKNTIELVSRELSIDDLNFYLLDSGKKRKTSDLVLRYLENYASNQNFKNGVDKISDCNDQIIEAALNPSEPDSMSKINTLSVLQYEFMQDLILDDIKQHWQASLAEEDVAFKLCGAGGGGYYLVISSRTLPKDLFDGFTLDNVEL